MQPVADSMAVPPDSMTPPTDRLPPARTPDPPAESPLLIRFSEAYRTPQSGNWRKSVTQFTELLQEHGLGAKRADVLFWLAQAHLKGGQHAQAEARLRELLRSYPNAWHAREAKEQLRLLQTEK
jgi:outer membrane protein assembly factor BamD (BamD/ComL family)